MSVDRWNTVLVLGGIRSGKSAFAESLVEDAASVRYVATSAGGEDDPEWRARIETHQLRRPQSWTTEETGADPARLAEVLAEAKPDETLLVDDLGGWVATLLDPANQPQNDVAKVDALAEAVRGCAARLVVVSPEVGLTLVPATPIGRAFTDALGTANQALAAACNGVVLVVAGQPTWLKGVAGTATPSSELIAEAFAGTDAHAKPEPAEAGAAPALAATAPAPAQAQTSPTQGQTVPARAETVPAHADIPPAQAQAGSAQAGTAPAQPLPESRLVTPAAPHETRRATSTADVLSQPTMMLPLVSSGVVIQPGMDLPMPDSDAGPDAHDRLGTLDLPGAGLGPLSEAIEFAAGTQNTARPQPWTSVRVLLFAGVHEGGAAAGDDLADVERRVAQVEAGEGALVRLAGTAGADVAVVRVPASGAMEHGAVLEVAEVEAALRQGWHLADAAGEAGRDALIIGSCGVGTDAAATAVLAATTGAEPVAVLPRVIVPGGHYDDGAWMVRCAAVRDALHRIRHEPRGAQDILEQIGGMDIAVATGALLGATARRIPVLLDGPVGIAAGLVARDFGSQTRHWCLLPDAGTSALVTQGADVLGLTPVLNLGLDLGEGVNALAALPLLRAAIGLAADLPVHPALLAGHDADGETDLGADGATEDFVANDDDEDFAEPTPGGPGPASSAGA